MAGLNSTNKWIGLTDQAVEGTFVWVTGEPLVYTIWAAGEPNNSNGDENCVEQYASGNWNDLVGTSTLPFVCEFEGNSDTVVLMKGTNTITASNVRLNSNSQLLFDVNLANASPGDWDVVITDFATGATATLPAGLVIDAASTSTVAAAIPAVSYKSTTQSIVVSGTVTSTAGAVNAGNVTFQIQNGQMNVGAAVTSGTLVNGATGSVSYVLPAGLAPGNYTLAATFNGTNSFAGSADTSQQLTVSPAALTVSPAYLSRNYGAANPTLTGTVSGAQSGDNITASYATNAGPASPVGTYTIAATLSDPSNRLSNYAVTLNTGTLTVNKAPLSVTGDNLSRPYGVANPLLTGSITGIQNNENITATYSTPAILTSPVGLYSIIPTLVDPDNRLVNYLVTITNGTLTVGASPVLTVTANNTARTYGASNPVFSGTITGIQNNDNITATYTTVATLNSPVGVYAIVPVLVDPDNKLANYIVSTNNGLLTVSQAGPLVITPANATRTYGAANPSFTGTITGILNGDNITAAYNSSATVVSPAGEYIIVPTLSDPSNKLGNYVLNINSGLLTITSAPLSVAPANQTRLYGAANPTLSGTLSGIKNGDNITASYSTVATPFSAVGTYTIVPTLSDPGNKLGNYTLTSNNGVLTVGQAPLSVTANNAGRQYGAANPSFSGSIVGIVNGDNIMAVYSTSATVSSAVGTYAIAATLVDPGAKLGNYSVTSTNGTLTIGQAPAITITAENASRIYGAANPEFGGTITGVLNGDTITATYATTATPPSAVGGYAIVSHVADPGNKLGNYALVVNNGTLTVTSAPLTVVPADASRTYGSDNPAFTGTLTGLQNNDEITATYATAATLVSAVGTYPIQATLTDPDNKLTNYTISLNSGTLTIQTAVLTVTTADSSRSYHDSNPEFTGSITGLVNNDPIIATYSTAATMDSDAGSYSIDPMLIDPNGLLGNYALTAISGTLTIETATPIINWPAPAAIVAGVALDAAQLNASASDPFTGDAVTGMFTYSPAPGTVLAPGLNQSLNVVFTPDNAADYSTATGASQLDVTPATSVSITSVLSMTATAGNAFSYTITADGSAPMVFSTGPLPDGLVLSENVISGTPSVSGIFDITLTVSNYAGSDSKLFKLTIIGNGVNHAPVFASLPTASSNPAATGVAVTLTASATDADGDTLEYSWNFGDGTTGLGASVSKTYAVAGLYVVTVTVSDGQANVVTSLNMVVQDQSPPGKFVVQKVSFSFNFVKGGKDELQVSGQIPLPPNFAPAGKMLRVLIGGVDKTYTLNASGDSEDKAFNLKGRLNGNTAPFSFMLKNQDLFAALEVLGLSKTQDNPNLDLLVIIALDGQSYIDNVTVKYVVKKNKIGPVTGMGKN